jgi:hypothetical protein
MLRAKPDTGAALFRKSCFLPDACVTCGRRRFFHAILNPPFLDMRPSESEQIEICLRGELKRG